MNTIKLFNESDAVILKAGDRVRLVEPEVLASRASNSDNISYTIQDGSCKLEYEDDELYFDNAIVNEDMLTLLLGLDTQEIESIDDDGDIKFYDIPYTWPKEVILEAVDENDIALNKYIDSSKVDYVRIYKDEVDYNTFLDYCSMPHAVLSKEDDGNSVYFYTVSQQNISPDKHLE